MPVFAHLSPLSKAYTFISCAKVTLNFCCFVKMLWVGRVKILNCKNKFCKIFLVSWEKAIDLDQDLHLDYLLHRGLTQTIKVKASASLNKPKKCLIIQSNFKIYPQIVLNYEIRFNLTLHLCIKICFYTYFFDSLFLPFLI